MISFRLIIFLEGVYMFVFRKLTYEDYNDVYEMCKDIWEGTDYLPEVFNKWVGDEKGVFLGAIHNDKVVGLGKYTILPDLKGWIEGLRVHKDYRGQKLGKSIINKLLDIAKDDFKGGIIKKIGTSTHISNGASMKMFKDMGFTIEQGFVTVIKKYKYLINEDMNLDNFDVKKWDISFDEFKDLFYFKKRNNVFHCDFIFIDMCEDLYNDLNENNNLVIINGHKGIIRYKKEPNFVCIDESFEGIDTFMNYCLQKHNKEYLTMTTIMKENKDLINDLKNNKYRSWNNWENDYLYFIYNI
jgi:GNAT superfamily N-acetyltransferase